MNDNKLLIQKIQAESRPEYFQPDPIPRRNISRNEGKIKTFSCEGKKTKPFHVKKEFVASMPYSKRMSAGYYTSRRNDFF